jgi:hypothetical protein
MKAQISILSILLLPCLLFQGCEKVIHVDLNSSSPQIIIEGNISDQDGPYFVKLSKSVNFDESNSFPTVSGAQIKLSDDSGGSEILVETEPGLYSTVNFPKGIPGHQYSLEVTIDGVEYKATSYMPFPVGIDSLTNETRSFGRTSTYLINVYLSDPAGQSNYYRFAEYRRGAYIPIIFVSDDRLTNGKAINYGLDNGDDDNKKLNLGDTITVAIENIDKNVYEYFYTLSLIAGNSGNESAAPANPTSNISNNALGYFCAKSVLSKSIVIR